MERNEFSELLKKINVELSEKQYDQFDKYYELLVEWNSFMNLTAITEYDEVLLKHFVDSLALKMVSEKILIDKENLSIVDVGTGAGFPGLPLKIAFPNLNVTLLDSLNKRVKFLNEVISQLQLTEISAIHSRAEDGARNVGLREHFDIGVSRAVANLSTLCEYVMPYVKVGGYFIAYKSGSVDEELENATKAIKILGGQVEEIRKFTLPDSDIDRSIIFIKKIQATSKKYPRKAGLPSKEPIC